MSEPHEPRFGLRLERLSAFSFGRSALLGAELHDLFTQLLDLFLLLQRVEGQLFDLLE